MSTVQIPLVIEPDGNSYRAKLYGRTIAIAKTAQLVIYKAGAILGSLEDKILQDLPSFYSEPIPKTDSAPEAEYEIPLPGHKL